MFVGFIVFLIVLHFLSLKLVLSDNTCGTKGENMKKTFTTQVIISSVLETIWTMGVGNIVGRLST